MEDTRDGRLPFLVKFGYGGAEGSMSLVWSTFYIFFMFFLTDVAHVAPATAGLIMLIATIWDAVTDPAVGILSDSIRSRWGRRRPFLIATAVPYGIITWFLFTDFHLGPKATVAYFIGIVILFFTAFTLVNIPYTALAAEMTSDYDERSRLIGFRVGWSQVATIIAAALALVIASTFKGILGSEKAGWSVVGAIFGFIAIFPIMLTWKVTKGYERFPERVGFKPRDVADAIFRNRVFRYTVGVYTFGAMAVNMAASIVVYFAKYNMGFSEEKSSVVLFVLFAATLVWVPVIAVCMSRWGKRWAFIIFAGSWAALQGIGILFIYPGRAVFLYVLMLLAAAGVAAVPFVGWAMVPDVVEVDEFKTGQRREGMYSGIMSFSQKAASAVALWVNGLVLAWVGYVADAKQTHAALTGIRLLLGWGPALFLIISIVFCYLMPMTKERHAALLDAIRRKKEGREWDEEAIKDLL